MRMTPAVGWQTRAPMAPPTDAIAAVQNLPADLLTDVLAHLTPQERVQGAARTCREWRQIARPPLSYRLLDRVGASDGAASICAALAAEGPSVAHELTHLDLRDRGLGDAGAAQVCAWLSDHVEKLHFLDLGGNGLTSAGAAALTLPSCLRALNLADNRLGSTAAADPAGLALRLPAGLQALNLSCNSLIDDAYLRAQIWPSSLRLLAVAQGEREVTARLDVRDVRQADAIPQHGLRHWVPPAHLADLVHLDVAFNASFAPASLPAVHHLDIRGTRSWRAFTSSLHQVHPVPELERLLLGPLADAQPRSLSSGTGLLTLGVAAGVGGVLASTLNLGWSAVLRSAVLGPCHATVVYIASADWHTRRFAYAVKRGGEPWHIDTAAPRPVRRLPRGAATLQAVAIGTIAGLAGVASNAVAGSLHQAFGAAGMLSAGFGHAVSESLHSPVFGALATGAVYAAVLGGWAAYHRYVARHLATGIMCVSAWAGAQAAAHTYVLAERLDLQARAYRFGRRHRRGALGWRDASLADVA